VNDLPIGNADSFTTPQNTPLVISVSRLLANDTDVEGNSISVVSIAPTASTHGTVSLSGGTVTYTPDPNYFGPSSFTYTVSDGQGGMAVGVVNVTVSQAGTPGKVTGGGSIDSGVRNFGFNVQSDQAANGRSFKGNVEFKDKKNRIDLTSTSIDMLSINTDGIHATFSGLADVNGVAGYRFTLEVEDRGEPGAGVDRFRMLIPALGYDSDVHATKGGVLDRGGNIQVHKMNAPLTARADSATSFSVETTSISIAHIFADPFDVNRDGALTALDALRVINRLNTAHDRALAELVADEIALLDVNRDGYLTALDALMVVNELNRRAMETAVRVGLAAQNVVEASLETTALRRRGRWQ
jgi:hypothetical protein